MEKPEYLIIAILIVLIIIINIFTNKSQKIYFFFNPKDQLSIDLLNNILKNNNNSEIILVTNNSDEEEVKKSVNNMRISKILNVENFSDLNEVIYDSCFKNAKCIFQPWDKFYNIKNRVNVFGYPFKFQNKVDTPSNLSSDVNGNAAFASNEDGTKTSGNITYGDKNVKNKKKFKRNAASQNPVIQCTNTRSSRGL